MHIWQVSRWVKICNSFYQYIFIFLLIKTKLARFLLWVSTFISYFMTHPVGLDPDALRPPLGHPLPSEDPPHVDHRGQAHDGRGAAVYTHWIRLK